MFPLLSPAPKWKVQCFRHCREACLKLEHIITQGSGSNVDYDPEGQGRSEIPVADKFLGDVML